MASKAELVIRVNSARGSSRIEYRSKGRYISLPVNGLAEQLLQQAVQPTSSQKNFWLSVLALVQSSIGAGP